MSGEVINSLPCVRESSIQCSRKREPEPCPSAGHAFDGDRAVVRLDHALDNEQAKARTTARRLAGTPESVKQVRQVFGRNARARVDHLKLGHVTQTAAFDPYGASRSRELDRVTDQIGEHLANAISVGGDKDVG